MKLETFARNMTQRVLSWAMVASSTSQNAMIEIKVGLQAVSMKYKGASS